MLAAVHALSLPGPFTLFLPLDSGFPLSLSPHSMRKVAARLQLLAAADAAAAAALRCHRFFPAFAQQLQQQEMQQLLQQQQELAPAAAAAAAETARERLSLLVKAHLVPGEFSIKRILTHVNRMLLLLLLLLCFKACIDIYVYIMYMDIYIIIIYV